MILTVAPEGNRVFEGAVSEGACSQRGRVCRAFVVDIDAGVASGLTLCYSFLAGVPMVGVMFDVLAVIGAAAAIAAGLFVREWAFRRRR